MNIFESIFKPFLSKKNPIKTTESKVDEDEYQMPYEVESAESASATKDKNSTIKRTRRLLANEIEAREAMEDIKNDAIVEEDKKMIMEALFIDKRKDTPKVILDPQTNTFKFEG